MSIKIGESSKNINMLIFGGRLVLVCNEDVSAWRLQRRNKNIH